MDHSKKMLGQEQIDFYREQGYLIADVLSPDEIKNAREKIDSLISLSYKADKNGRDFPKKTSSSFQHFGDSLDEYGREARHYYFHIMTATGTQALHTLLLHQKIQGLVEELLGPDLILNNFSLLAAEPGIKYKLGWHRDIIQIPEQEIDERIFSPAWFHNNLQFNLALNDDDCLWAVPGSHIRPNTPDENAAFNGSRHYAPMDAEMPGGIPIPLRPGQAAFYNNNLIHRGYAPKLTTLRRTIHMGFHSGVRPPTWHFYLLDEKRLTPGYLDTLAPDIRRMMIRYLELKKKYPRMEDTWPKADRPLSEVLSR
ncbi:MAG: phytanoyl-CoA dioxygenase family protein [Fibrobacteria bacterium]